MDWEWVVKPQRSYLHLSSHLMLSVDVRKTYELRRYLVIGFAWIFVFFLCEWTPNIHTIYVHMRSFADLFGGKVSLDMDRVRS